MPRPQTTMRSIRDCLRLRLCDGLSLRQIGQSLSLPHSTVADHIRRGTAAGLTSWAEVDALDDEALRALLWASNADTGSAAPARPEPDFAHVRRELRRKGVTLILLWLEFNEANPGGYSYPTFCRHYRTWRARVDVTMHQDHVAGQKLFIDFSGLTIPISRDDLTVAYEAELFVCTLGTSSLLYAEALRSQGLEHWIGAHVRAFAFYGGVPELLVPDNLRSAVTRAHRYEPDLNATYQELATHYGTAILPARPYKPRDKAKVEVGVQVAQRWVVAPLRHQRFFELSALNEAIFSLTEAVNDKAMSHGDGSRRQLFETFDRPALRGLPAHRYEFAAWKRAKVNIDYHVGVETNFYSVPYTLARGVVEVRVTSKVIEIFANHRRVASHQRSYGTRCYVTNPEHMPSSHRRHAEWTPSRMLAWAQQTGPATEEVVSQIMERRPHPEQGFRAVMGVMRLAKRFSPERLEAACVRACTAQAYSFRSIESILSQGLDQRPLPSSTPQRTTPVHENLRGPDYYQ